MENAGYATLTRQVGLMREIRVVANNIANSSTTGFRQEGLVFAEHVIASPEAPSLSMAVANTRNTSFLQGTVRQTDAPLDLAIQGHGFFTVETDEGQHLTRAGSFTTDAAGELVTPDGLRVLDAGGAPIFIPPDASNISVAADGTLSAAGRPIAQIGVVIPEEGTFLTRLGGVRFSADGPTRPAAGTAVLQGFLENSNVDPIGQVSRMIEVQRAYELGQNFMDTENERLRAAIDAFFKP